MWDKGTLGNISQVRKMWDKGAVVKTFPRLEECGIKGQWLKPFQVRRMWDKGTVFKTLSGQKNVG